MISQNTFSCTRVTFLVRFFIRLQIRSRHVPVESTQTQAQTDSLNMLNILYSVRSKIIHANVDADANADADGPMER